MASVCGKIARVVNKMKPLGNKIDTVAGKRAPVVNKMTPESGKIGKVVN